MIGRILALIVTGISVYGGVTNLFDVFESGGPQTIESLYLLIWFIGGTIFGCISNHVAKTKGYNNGFFWGYWLGLIGLLVVGLRGDKQKIEPVKKNSIPTVIPSNAYDPIEHLERITRLHAQGTLTDDEFQKQKALILSRM